MGATAGASATATTPPDRATSMTYTTAYDNARSQPDERGQGSVEAALSQRQRQILNH